MSTNRHQLILTIDSLPARELEIYGGSNQLLTPYATAGTTYDWCFLPICSPHNRLANWIHSNNANSSPAAQLLPGQFDHTTLYCEDNFSTELNFTELHGLHSSENLPLSIEQWLENASQSQAQTHLLWLHFTAANQSLWEQLLLSDAFLELWQTSSERTLEITLSALRGSVTESSTSLQLSQCHVPFLKRDSNPYAQQVARRASELITPVQALDGSESSDSDQLVLWDESGRPALMTRRCLYRSTACVEKLESPEQLERFFLPDDYELRNNVAHLDLELMKQIYHEFQNLNLVQVDQSI